MTSVIKDRTDKDGPPYVFEVDGVPYEWPDATVTGAEIMETAGIDVSIGIVLVHEDGTQESISPDRTITLKAGQRIKKRPRFKRG